LNAVFTIDFNIVLAKLNFYGFATHVKQIAIRLADSRFKAWELSVQRVKFLSRDVTYGDQLSGNYMQKRLFVEVVERV
jgi:hypothetical protein